MVNLTTDTFPYTASYVKELLGIEDSVLMEYVHQLSIQPKRDEKTSQIIFQHHQLDQLRKAVGLRKDGESFDTIRMRLGIQANGNASRSASLNATNAYTANNATVVASSDEEPTYKPYSSVPADQSGVKTSLTQHSQAIASANTGAKDGNLAVMIETVGQVKDGILKDLGRLLDDKLSGLDEVVVELIRCKSENDSLQKKLNEANRRNEYLEDELNSFHQVQFGFYRKD